MAKYLDISNYQPSFPFKTAKREGYDGVWILATEGTGFVNPLLSSQVLGARAAGLRVGFYHYAEPDKHPALAEAAHFVSQIERYGIQRRDLRPMLDMERGNPHAAYEQWSRDWNKVVKNRLGVGPLFYSNPSYIRGMKVAKPIGYGLFLAAYGRNDGTRYPPIVPYPWSRYAAHQYTSVGKIPGYPHNVDLDYVPTLTKSRVLAHPITGLV